MWTSLTRVQEYYSKSLLQILQNHFIKSIFQLKRKRRRKIINFVKFKKHKNFETSNSILSIHLKTHIYYTQNGKLFLFENNLMNKCITNLTNKQTLTN